jgi:hypothetical protein
LKDRKQSVLGGRVLKSRCLGMGGMIEGGKLINIEKKKQGEQ